MRIRSAARAARPLLRRGSQEKGERELRQRAGLDIDQRHPRAARCRFPHGLHCGRRKESSAARNRFCLGEESLAEVSGEEARRVDGSSVDGDLRGHGAILTQNGEEALSQEELSGSSAGRPIAARSVRPTTAPSRPQPLGCAAVIGPGSPETKPARSFARPPPAPPMAAPAVRQVGVSSSTSRSPETDALNFTTHIFVCRCHCGHPSDPVAHAAVLERACAISRRLPRDMTAAVEALSGLARLAFSHGRSTGIWTRLSHLPRRGLR